MAKQPTVRMNETTKLKLDKIQAQTELSQPALLDRAIDLLERDMLAQQMESDFKDLVTNPEVLKRYSQECDVFDGAGADGLRRE